MEEEETITHVEKSFQQRGRVSPEKWLIFSLCLLASQAFIWGGGLLISTLIGPLQAFSSAMLLELMIILAIVFYFKEQDVVQHILLAIADHMGQLVEIHTGEYTQMEDVVKMTQDAALLAQHAQNTMDITLASVRDLQKILEQTDTRLAAIEARGSSTKTRRTTVNGTTSPALKSVKAVPAAEAKKSEPLTI